MKKENFKKWALLAIAVFNGLLYLAAKTVLFFKYNSEPVTSVPRWIDSMDLLSKIVMAVLCLYIMILFIFLAYTLRQHVIYQNGELSR